MLWCGCSVEAPTNMGRKSFTREGVSYGCGLREAWWRGGDGGGRRGRGWLWSLAPTRLKTGHYMGSLIRGRFGCGGGRYFLVVVAVAEVSALFPHDALAQH